MVELRDKAAASLVHFHAHVFVDPADVAGSMPAWKDFYERIAAAFKDHKCASGRLFGIEQVLLRARRSVQWLMVLCSAGEWTHAMLCYL